MNEKFYMVYAEGKEAPVRKHLRLEDAKAEARRISEKEGVECYILGSQDAVKVDKPIEVRQNRPCKVYWYKITGDAKKDAALKDKLIELMPNSLYAYQPIECEFEAGRIVYNYHNHIKIENDIDRTFSQIVKMFGTELRVKGGDYERSR